MSLQSLEDGRHQLVAMPHSIWFGDASSVLFLMGLNKWTTALIAMVKWWA
jgi:hypothetical protein